MIIKIIETYYKIRFMEPGCTHNTVASNNTAQFRYKAKTNALGKAAIAPKTKTNKTTQKASKKERERGVNETGHWTSQRH